MVSDVLSRLNLPANTPAAQFSTGTGLAPVETTQDAVKRYLNDSAAELARTCYPLRDTASASVAPSTRIVALSSLTSMSGGVMWAARAVTFNGVQLRHTSRSSLELWHRTWLTDPAGVPGDWYEQGEDGIGLYPVPAAASGQACLGLGGLLLAGLCEGGGVMLADGLVVPARMTDDDDTLPYQPDLVTLCIFRAASRLAKKNAQDGSLAVRIQEWEAEWLNGTSNLLARLWRMDPDLAAAHFPALPSGK